MKERFEKTLGDYKNAIKAEEESETSDSEIDMKSTAEYAVDLGAFEQGTSLKAQKNIFAIQKEKQELMSELHTELASLDNEEVYTEPKEGLRSLRCVNGFFIYKDSQGISRKATFGQILADMDWGIFYKIDQDSGVPRHMAKKYFVRKAKTKLMNLLDKQILLNEVENPNLEKTKKETYKRIKIDKENKHEDEMPGFIAEKIVQNLLERSAVDHDLPFEVLSADVYEDVEYKLDLILRVKKTDQNRGVDVEVSKSALHTEVRKLEYGIQYTTSETAKALDHKKQQIEKAIHKMDAVRSKSGLTIEEIHAKRRAVGDIYLVSFPLKQVVWMKDFWEKHGKISGGPGVFLDQETASHLFEKLLTDLFKPEEISQFWQKVKDDYKPLQTAA